MKHKLLTFFALLVFAGFSYAQDGYEYVMDIDTVTNPHGVAVDPDGKIWYASHQDSIGVIVLNPDLTPASFSPITTVTIGGTEHNLYNRLKGMEVDPDGNIVLVMNSVELYRLNYQDGSGMNFLNLKTLPNNGDSIGSFSKPGIDDAGNIYIAAVVPVNNAIWKLNPDFTHKSNIVDLQDAAWWSRAVEVTPDGKDVYMSTLWASPRVIQFHSEDGVTYEMVNELPEPEFGFGGQVSSVEFDKKGRLWISDEGVDNQCYWIYDFATASFSQLKGEGESAMDLPRGLAFSPDSKTIYITNFNSGRIMKWALPAGPSVSLFDDFEDGDNTNAFGGTWQLTGGLAGTLAFEVVSNEGYNSTHSLHVTGNYANWPGAEGALDASSAPVDVSGYNGIQFAVKAVTVDTLRVRIREQKRVDNGTYEFAKFDFVPTSEWTIVQVPFSAMVSSYTSGPLDPAFDATDITHIDFEPFKSNRNGDFYIDQIEFITDITGIEKDNSSLPTEFSLSQNYPNPFNPATTIEFSLTQGGFTTLKVYDVIGNEVATLVNEELTSGNFKTQFDASQLSSGIYFYTLRVNNSVLTNKMLLLK